MKQEEDKFTGLPENAFRELKPGECKISLRSGDSGFNASLACARLGGGGHAAAAGCVVYGTVEEAKTAIVAAIEAQLAE